MEPWEMAVDAISDAVYEALKRNAMYEEAEEMMQGWVTTLNALFADFSHQTTADFDEEVLEVVSTVLRACSDQQWRSNDNKEGDVYSQSIFTSSFLRYITKSAHRLIRKNSYCEGLRTTLAEIIDSLYRLAVSEVEVQLVLDEMIQETTTRQLFLDQSSVTDEISPSIALTRFLFIMKTSEKFGQPLSLSSDPRPILRRLIGHCDTDHWIRDKWEKTWHLTKCADTTCLLFNSSNEVVPSIKKLLDGFSIPQTDAPPGLTLPKLLLSLRNYTKLRGLHRDVDVTLVKNGFVDAGRIESRRVTSEEVTRGLDDGYSVGIRGMQARSSRIFALCSSLQRELGQYVNANLYWTPPNQQGFKIHIDDHCVFAIQLKGRKRWHLFKQLPLLPVLYDDTESVLQSSSVKFDTEVLLEEGDILYVPRGVPHYAETNDLGEESVHLTVGIEIEGSFTCGRVMSQFPHEYSHSYENPPSSSEGSISRAGLMAWHLQSVRSLQMALPKEYEESKRGSLDQLRQHLLKKRREFLAARSLHAQAMSSLHAAYGMDMHGIDEQTLIPTKEPSHALKKMKI